jgi:putative transcriptional regulator
MTATTDRGTDGENLMSKHIQATEQGYHYVECGLPDVWLANGFEILPSPYGDTIKIDNLDGLHKCIAMCLVSKADALTGDEFKFLRTELDYSQFSLAGILSVTDRTIRDWEAQAAVTEPANTMIRFIYKQTYQPDANFVEMSKALRRVQELDRELHELKLQKRKLTIRINETEKAWVVEQSLDQAA